MPLPREKQTIKKAATGQPFALGMLYDCRNDALIPGLTLWDEKDLKENLQETLLQTSNYHIEYSDTLSAKASLLGVEGNLKLSILCGLIDISGAASFLRDRVSSSLQERVTMRYKCTTKSKNLTMEHLGKDRIMHTKVLTDDLATHVVTGITYGARAFLTFDRKHESNETKQNVHGEIRAMVDKIPSVGIGTGAELDINDKEKDTAEHMSCKFYGDFIPKDNPTTYQQAVALCQNISQQLGENNENALPVEVSLLPLIYLDQQATMLVCNIEDDLVEKATNILEKLHDLDVKCNDLLETKAGRTLKYSENKIKKLRNLGSRYKTFFQNKIAQILPEIRGGRANVSELSEILMAYEKSPFSGALDVAKKHEIETNILTKYLEYLSDIRFATEFESVIFGPTMNTVACFKIQCPMRDPSSEHLERYLENQDKVSDVDQTIEPKSEYISTKLRINARRFLEFCKANKDSNIEFVIAESSANVACVTGQIDIYESDGEKVADFDIPTSNQPKCEAVSEDSIKVMWDMTSGDNITGFVIKYTDSKGIEKFTDSTLTEHTLTDLTPSESYEIAVCAKTRFGCGPYVDAKGPISLCK